MRRYEARYDSLSKLGVVAVIDGDGERELKLDQSCNPVPTENIRFFSWGINARTTAQLALAICIDALDGDVLRAARVYPVFKHHLMQMNPDEGFTITKAQVLARLVAIDEVLQDRTTRPASKAAPF